MTSLRKRLSKLFTTDDLPRNAEPVVPPRGASRDSEYDCCAPADVTDKSTPHESSNSQYKGNENDSSIIPEVLNKLSGSFRWSASLLHKAEKEIAFFEVPSTPKRSPRQHTRKSSRWSGTLSRSSGISKKGGSQGRKARSTVIEDAVQTPSRVDEFSSAASLLPTPPALFVDIPDSNLDDELAKETSDPLLEQNAVNSACEVAHKVWPRPTRVAFKERPTWYQPQPKSPSPTLEDPFEQLDPSTYSVDTASSIMGGGKDWPFAYKRDGYLCLRCRQCFASVELLQDHVYIEHYTGSPSKRNPITANDRDYLPYQADTRKHPGNVASRNSAPEVLGESASPTWEKGFFHANEGSPPSHSDAASSDANYYSSPFSHPMGSRAEWESSRAERNQEFEALLKAGEDNRWGIYDDELYKPLQLPQQCSDPASCLEASFDFAAKCKVSDSTNGISESPVGANDNQPLQSILTPSYPSSLNPYAFPYPYASTHPVTGAVCYTGTDYFGCAIDEARQRPGLASDYFYPSRAYEKGDYQPPCPADGAYEYPNAAEPTRAYYVEDVPPIPPATIIQGNEHSPYPPYIANEPNYSRAYDEESESTVELFLNGREEISPPTDSVCATDEFDSEEEDDGRDCLNAKSPQFVTTDELAEKFAELSAEESAGEVKDLSWALRFVADQMNVVGMFGGYPGSDHGNHEQESKQESNDWALALRLISLPPEESDDESDDDTVDHNKEPRRCELSQLILVAQDTRAKQQRRLDVNTKTVPSMDLSGQATSSSDELVKPLEQIKITTQPMSELGSTGDFNIGLEDGASRETSEHTEVKPVDKSQTTHFCAEPSSLSSHAKILPESASILDKFYGVATSAARRCDDGSNWQYETLPEDINDKREAKFLAHMIGMWEDEGWVTEDIPSHDPLEEFHRPKWRTVSRTPPEEKQPHQ